MVAADRAGKEDNIQVIREMKGRMEIERGQERTDCKSEKEKRDSQSLDKACRY
ncbi:MAG: hypothetical protein ACMUIM_10250 [bacterium]